MSESETTPEPEPPREIIAPRHESVHAAFGDEIQAGPDYGAARLSLIARGPHELVASWEFDIAEHPEARGADGETHFLIRPLRGDGFAEPAVKIVPDTGRIHIPVSQADALYTAELGFFAPGEVWCFIARSSPVRTSLDGAAAQPRPAAPLEQKEHAPLWTPEQEKELQRLLEQDTKPAGDDAE